MRIFGWRYLWMSLRHYWYLSNRSKFKGKLSKLWFVCMQRATTSEQVYWYFHWSGSGCCISKGVTPDGLSLFLALRCIFANQGLIFTNVYFFRFFCKCKSIMQLHCKCVLLKISDSLLQLFLQKSASPRCWYLILLLLIWMFSPPRLAQSLFRGLVE